MGTTTYSISELANMSGTSVRTLHHYDRIGLLVPSRMENGYRTYGEREVKRLQQILLWKACGIELRRIGSLMDDPEYDESLALNRQLDVLLQRRAELDGTIENVRTTLQSLEEGGRMADKKRFEGLKRKAIDDNERTYGEEVRTRFGDKAMDDANAALLAMDEENRERLSKRDFNTNFLVSAGAGAGKTYLTVNRAFNMLCDKTLNVFLMPLTFDGDFADPIPYVANKAEGR